MFADKPLGARRRDGMQWGMLHEEKRTFFFPSLPPRFASARAARKGGEGKDKKVTGAR